MTGSVSKIFQVLDTIANYDGKPRLVDLQAILPFPKASLHRYVNELLEAGLIRKALSDGTYAPGYHLLSLAKKCAVSSDLIQASKYYMNGLNKQYDETISLYVLDKGEVIIIDQVDTSHTIRPHSKIGDKSPLHCSSAGKIFLAFLQEPQRQKIIDSLLFEHFTDYTHDHNKDFYQELEKDKNLGYAIDQQEQEIGLFSVSVPIFSPQEKMIAALTITFPSFRVSKQIQDDIICELKKSSSLITQSLRRIIV